MWSNYHCHTNYCDGKNTVDEMIASAIEQNVVSLGLSSHAPLPFASPWCMKEDQLSNYLIEIESAKKKFKNIEIYKSLEIDFIPDTISPIDFKPHLDYTVGSVHFVEQLNDGRHWEIDGTHSFFLEGYQSLFNRDIKAVIHRYYELIRQMVEQSQPDIVGHLDKIKIQNIDDQFFNESDHWYRQEINQTLDAIKKNGSIIEVNTRGIYQKKSKTTYPSPSILEKIHEKKIPVTLSSDAHHYDDLINQFPETVITLNSIGFKKIRILSDGNWQDIALDKYGI